MSFFCKLEADNSSFFVSATRTRWNFKILLCLVSLCHVEKINIVGNNHGHKQNCDFSVWLEISFLSKFQWKIKLKFGTRTNSNMQNQVVMFTFSVFHWKYHFRKNFFPKFKIASLTWNLVLRQIRICRIHWWCSLFLF